MAFPVKHGHPISAHDKAVLSQIFNPGFPAGDNEETTDPDQNDGALDDLNMAIVLSKGKGKAACQAFTQRGIIRRLEGDNEAALEDFKAAAHLGSELATHGGSFEPICCPL
ncbi:hypothetical protein C0Q70_03960 [Pomacea canaliculata]|uniref:Uncharacterized protein n=1 Tax=Pomacea canaliculata TaxID=400727 RepID=A0A2T7PUB3_POMCA|nr:hypothetical protein C0Q70_03960 [Pomacea canaliculata]